MHSKKGFTLLLLLLVILSVTTSVYADIDHSEIEHLNRLHKRDAGAILEVVTSLIPENATFVDDVIDVIDVNETLANDTAMLDADMATNDTMGDHGEVMDDTDEIIDKGEVEDKMDEIMHGNNDGNETLVDDMIDVNGTLTNDTIMEEGDMSKNVTKEDDESLIDDMIDVTEISVNDTTIEGGDMITEDDIKDGDQVMEEEEKEDVIEETMTKENNADCAVNDPLVFMAEEVIEEIMMKENNTDCAVKDALVLMAEELKSLSKELKEMKETIENKCSSSVDADGPAMNATHVNETEDIMGAVTNVEGTEMTGDDGGDNTTMATTTEIPIEPTSTLPPIPWSCVPPFQLVANGCFYFLDYRADWRSWGESQAYCQTIKGKLASPVRLDDFRAYLKQTFSNVFWVGGKKSPRNRPKRSAEMSEEPSKGLKKSKKNSKKTKKSAKKAKKVKSVQSFEWLSGDAFTEDDWKEGYPKRGGKNCVYLEPFSDYGAVNHYCGEKFPFVCEHEGEY